MIRVLCEFVNVGCMRVRFTGFLKYVGTLTNFKLYALQNSIGN